MRDTNQQTLASMAGTCLPAALMHLYYKSFQSMVPGEAFCQVVCLVVTPALDHCPSTCNARRRVGCWRYDVSPAHIPETTVGGGAWTSGVPSLPHQVLG